MAKKTILYTTPTDAQSNQSPADMKDVEDMNQTIATFTKDAADHKAARVAARQAKDPSYTPSQYDAEAKNFLLTELAKQYDANFAGHSKPEEYSGLGAAADIGLRALDYVPGIARTAMSAIPAALTGTLKGQDIIDTLNGQAPSTEVYMQRAGIPQGGALSDVVPSWFVQPGTRTGFQMEKGGMFDITPRGTAATLLDSFGPQGLEALAGMALRKGEAGLARTARAALDKASPSDLEKYLRTPDQQFLNANAPQSIGEALSSKNGAAYAKEKLAQQIQNLGGGESLAEVTGKRAAPMSAQARAFQAFTDPMGILERPAQSLQGLPLSEADKAARLKYVKEPSKTLLDMAGNQNMARSEILAEKKLAENAAAVKDILDTHSTGPNAQQIDAYKEIIKPAFVAAGYPPTTDTGRAVLHGLNDSTEQFFGKIGKEVGDPLTVKEANQFKQELQKQSAALFESAQQAAMGNPDAAAATASKLENQTVAQALANASTEARKLVENKIATVSPKDATTLHLLDRESAGLMKAKAPLAEGATEAIGAPSIGAERAKIGLLTKGAQWAAPVISTAGQIGATVSRPASNLGRGMLVNQYRQASPWDLLQQNIEKLKEQPQPQPSGAPQK